MYCVDCRVEHIGIVISKAHKVCYADRNPPNTVPPLVPRLFEDDVNPPSQYLAISPRNTELMGFTVFGLNSKFYTPIKRNLFDRVGAGLGLVGAGGV